MGFRRLVYNREITMEDTTMKKISWFAVLAGVVGLALSAPSWAEPSSLVAFDKETRALLKSGDVARGAELSESKKCVRCHGDAGVAEEDEDVNLAGQLPSYLLKQMLDYKSEHRESRDMKKALRKVSEQEMADMAQYYGSLALPEAAYVESGNVIQLVKKGDHTRMVQSCNACHGQSGQGDAFEAPALVGQKPGYLIETLQMMRDGERTNDVYSRMRIVAKALTDEEIEALAKYYGQKPAAE